MKSLEELAALREQMKNKVAMRQDNSAAGCGYQPRRTFVMLTFSPRAFENSCEALVPAQNSRKVLFISKGVLGTR